MKVLPDVDGLVTDDGELTGAAPLGPSAGTIEVEGTSSSAGPAANDGAENASVVTIAATRAIFLFLPLLGTCAIILATAAYGASLDVARRTLMLMMCLLSFGKQKPLVN